MSGLVESLKALSAKVSRATSSIIDEITRLRATIKQKRDELLRLQTSLIPLPEAEARARQVVETRGRLWVENYGNRCLRFPGEHGSRGLAEAGELKNGNCFLPWDQDGGGLPFGALCAADPEGATTMLLGLLRRVRDAGKYLEGPPSAERAAVIARAEAELAELEATEERAIDAAADVGLVIQHRPEVVQRRQGEARKLELEEKAIADRRARQAALDAARDPKLRGRS